MTLPGIVNAMRKYRFNIGTHLPRGERAERPSARGKLSRRVAGARCPFGPDVASPATNVLTAVRVLLRATKGT